MPIFVSSSLAPKSGATWFILEDKYLRGGLQVCATLTVRNAIDAFNRKAGMLAFVAEDQTLYMLEADLTTWTEAQVAPSTHTHAAADITADPLYQFVTEDDKTAWSAKQDPSEKGQPNGYAPLDAAGLLPENLMPPISITDTYVVVDEVEMLATGAQRGDVAVRTDLNKSFILRGSHSTVLDNWQELLTPTTGVISVSAVAPIVNSGTAQAPNLTLAPSSNATDGYMSAAQAAKLDSIAPSATAYEHPVGDGNLHVPATSTTSNGKVLTAGATAGSLSWATPAATGVTNVSGNSPLVIANPSTTPTISLPAATSSVDGYLKATDWVTFNSKGTGIVTGVTGAGAISVTGTTAPVISIDAATTSAPGTMSAADKIKLDGIAEGAVTDIAEGTRTATSVLVTSSTGADATLSAATTSLAGVMAAADKTKLDGIASGATAYTHPAGDVDCGRHCGFSVLDYSGCRYSYRRYCKLTGSFQRRCCTRYLDACGYVIR